MVHPNQGKRAGGEDWAGDKAAATANELIRLDQALIDLKLSEGSEVTLFACTCAEQQQNLALALTDRARRWGFVTATLSLSTHSLTELDQVVRAVIEGFETAGRNGERGLAANLRAFARRNPTEAAARFARAAVRWGVAGDLTTLCLGLLAADTSERCGRRLEAWLDGIELGRVEPNSALRGALTERTARRALVEFTRLVRCLGYSGLVLCLTDGDHLARRPPRQRERAYTLLRELIDNFDSGRGMTSTRLIITGGERLFVGQTSLRSLPALASRIETPSTAAPPPPHRSCAQAESDEGPPSGSRPQPVEARARRALRTLIRVAQGLPPTEAVASMSVGHERIDAVITDLLAHARLAGSVFSVLEGDYGTGKTHLLLHLADRALAAGHPVFRLNLERLNLDLGNPARHYGRLLADSELPMARRPTALEWLARATRSPATCGALLRAIEAVAVARSEASIAAKRVLRITRGTHDVPAGIERFLGGRDLENKPGSPVHRRDAYSRLLLLTELFQRIQRWQGPVLLIDEAENLYVSGVSRAARRTALRSLAFYCGGALPSTCVVMTSTPRALAKLRYEAGELLHDVSTMGNSLAAEDAEMLSRRLMRLSPLAVPALAPEHRAELVARVVATHAAVRGPGWPLEVGPWLASNEPPRVLIRRLVDELESSWWRHRRAGAAQPGMDRTAVQDCFDPAAPDANGHG
ncbi:MAG: DUF2791 family P-loop domain-containing protein [Polyangiaceae bacterium]|nr:DUF2791 family P-loop domain-containing protein [Polyangiaceae bacterium]